MQRAQLTGRFTATRIFPPPHSPRTSRRASLMSAFGGKADIKARTNHVFYECPPSYKERRQSGFGRTHVAGVRGIAIARIGLLLALAAFTGPAAADDYPSRSIRLIIPFPPGGSNDVGGRIIANQLGDQLGRPGVGEHRTRSP